ncbi:proton-coupled amino acid transporter-like protein CG1139 [Anthonomus grandis grandis]|uniref:proton-coupled amino acid transporter-like protein CG1139 n=1 Tax=Anthonomus grandis grandis TaxID=2921223 RepID=UPI002165CACC|nr:proton-coupled amino acid transporter-like protein CG1139 [Anthonomus grandis grandis]
MTVTVKENNHHTLTIPSLETYDSKTELVNNEKCLSVPVLYPIPCISVPEKIYSPHEHRQLTHPNNFLGAFLHLVKSSLGTGVLAVPRAFKSAGLLVGLIGNILIGILCTHTVYILVKTSEKVCARGKIPSLGFADTAEEVFKQGPKPLRRYSGAARLFVEIALVSTYYLGVAVYMVFISVSLTKLLKEYYPQAEEWDKYLLKLIIMSLLMFLCQIREIKHLVPFSFIANVALAVVFGITGYYIFSGLDEVKQETVHFSNGFSGIPSFFSTVLFAMEGIGTIMPVENSMPKPKFLGPCGVLNSAMVVIVFFFTSIGFLGYYRYGDATEVTITKNLPDDEILAQIVQAAIAISVFFSFMLQFYIPTDIMWKRLKRIIPREKHNLAQIALRTIMVAIVTAIAIAGGEDLGSLIDLVGAIFFSSLGFLIPAGLEIIVDFEDGWGRYHWKLIKNVLIICLAIFALVSGSYYAILDMIEK